MSDRRFIIDNFAFRTGLIFPGAPVNVGVGAVFPTIVVIHKGHVTVDRDAITGALKRFDLLDHSYRIPAQILNPEHWFRDKENQQLVVELIEILRPQLVVCAGEAAIAAVNTTGRKASSLIGKTFQINDLTSCRACGILDPETYSFARASTETKERGKRQWEAISKLIQKSKAKS